MTARPNIVWLVTDHQVHGNRNFAPGLLPLQDRLARSGTTFTNAYTVLPICSPSRASMLTGLYPHAHGLTENDGRFGGRAGLEPSDWLVHQPLLDAGYRCAWFGKWHLNNSRSAQGYGFEGFSLPGYGYPYGTGRYRDYLSSKDLARPEVIIEQAGESRGPAGGRLDLTEQQDWFDYEAGCARLLGDVRCHEAYFLAEEASAWLKQVADESFFLRVDPWGPHPPYIVGAPFHGRIDPGQVTLPESFFSELPARPDHHSAYARYWEETLGLDLDGWRFMAARAIEHTLLVETALTRILDALENLGVSGNTIVIFCADHGDAVASNGRVSNKGGLMVEETMRIPLLTSGPGIPAGTVVEDLAANIDLAPTILELCGLNPKQGAHGQSLVPLIAGTKQEWRPALMTQHYGLHQRIVQRACHAGSWKYVVQDDGFEELYDLAHDPFELENLACTNGASLDLERMRAHLRSEMNRTGDPELAILDRVRG